MPVAPTIGSVDNTLDYIDQASFLGLRALGHGPVIQFTWIYARDVDLDAVVVWLLRPPTP